CSERLHLGESWFDLSVGGASSPAGSLSVPIFRGRGWAEVLRARPDRAMAWSGNLRRSHPARREARPIAGSSADKVRAGGQPQDREGAWVEHPACISAARRRGDRMSAKMKRRAFITLLGGASA